VQDQKEAELGAKQEEIKALQAKIDSGRLSLTQDKLADMEKAAGGQGHRGPPAAGRRQPRLEQAQGRRPGRRRPAGDADHQPARQGAGFTLIFRKFESGLIYADEAIDITPMVIQRLDAAQGK